nr:uncharacterized protein LOC113816881 [Penaeus vannamei]
MWTFVVLTVALTAAAATAMDMKEAVAEAEAEARYIYINAEAPITIAALLNVPISLALPSLNLLRGRSFSSSWRAEEELQDDLEQLFDDPHYLVEANKLRAYFSYLKLENEKCRQKFLCELATDPEAFFPASDIFLKELQPSHGPVKEDAKNRFWLYQEASRAGLMGGRGECVRLFPACRTPITDIINTSVLKVWQFIGRKLNISFTDN